MASFLKKLAKGVGKVAKVAAPVLAATGVGLPIAAAVGAAGGALQGGKPKEWLKRAGMGAGGAALGGLAGKALGTSGIAKSGGGWLGKLQAAGKAAGGVAGKVGGAQSMMGGGGGGGGGMSLADLAQLGMAGYGMYQGNQDLGRARALDDRMLNMAESEWAAGAPLRDRARELAMGGGGAPPPSMFRDQNNPFARMG